MVISEVEKDNILKKTYNPVRTGRDTHTLSTHVEREDFSGNNPSQGTPGDSEVGNVPVDLEDNS